MPVSNSQWQKVIIMVGWKHVEFMPYCLQSGWLDWRLSYYEPKNNLVHDFINTCVQYSVFI